MIVEKLDHLRDKPVQKQFFTDTPLIAKLLNNEEMPLLVVLLDPAFLDAVEDATCKSRIAMRVGHCNVGHVFPSLIRDPSNDLKYLKFGKGLFVSVQDIHGNEKEAGEKAVTHARRCVDFLLFLLELIRC